MKNLCRILLIGCIGTFSLASCMKDDVLFDPGKQLKLDSIAIREYVTANGISAVRDDETGIWYEILEPGETAGYTYKFKDTLGFKWVWFNARVKYQGKLLNGTVFDKFEADTGLNLQIASALTVDYPFDGSILPAWVYTFVPHQIDGVELNGIFTTGLQKGTKIRIITPSLWAYQNSTNGTIPANSPLEFIIEVKDIQDNRTVAEE